MMGSRLSAASEVDGGFISVTFTISGGLISHDICVIKNRTGGLKIESPVSAPPGIFNRLASRFILGIKTLEPIFQIRGLEHPEAVIRLYQGLDRNGRIRKLVQLQSSHYLGSYFLSINDPDYELIRSVIIEASAA